MNFKNFFASYLWKKHSFSFKNQNYSLESISYIKTYISFSRLHDGVGFVKSFFMRGIFEIVFSSL